MIELILYAILFLMLIGHTLLAAKMYKTVHEDQTLGLREKNYWKLNALIFPLYYWGQYKKGK